MAAQPSLQSLPDRFPVNEAWLASWQEEIIEPELAIVDAHHHLANRHRRYLFDEYLADLRTGHNIVATVHVDAGLMYRADGPREEASLGETEFIAGIAGMAAGTSFGRTRMCQGLVGYVDLGLGAAAEPLLAAHIAAAGGRFRGVRLLTMADEDPTFVSVERTLVDRLADKGFREGFAALGRLGLSFDAWVYHPQLGDIGDLAAAYETTPIILNHMGGLLGIGRYAGRREESVRDWRRSMTALARHPNVTVKLGGLGMPIFGFGYGQRPVPPSSSDLATDWRPLIEFVIDTFGPSRTMFEANAPADKTSYSYPVVWNAFKRIAAGYSADEKAELFAGTARRVYRLD